MVYRGQLLITLSIFSIILFLMLGSVTITAADPIAHSCSLLSYASRTSNSSRYLANLDLLLQSLSSHANDTSGTGFYNTTVGDGADKVYGLFLCRGDLTSNECQTCIETASAEIKQLCPNNTAAVAYYDNCVFRYANQSIFSVLQQEPFRYGAALQDVTKLDQYNQSVSGLLNRLLYQAINGSSFAAATPRYYAAGQEEYYTGFDTIYALVQCTPDITPMDCNYCLTGSLSLDVPRFLYPKLGGRILKPSCNLRYEFNSPFYETTTPPPPAATTPPVLPTGKGRRSTQLTIILVVVSIVTFIVVIIIFVRCRTIRKMKFKAEGDQFETTSGDCIQFKFDKIRAATDNFSDENKLGEGGFGTVYKGRNLLNEQIVAVKRLSRTSHQGEIEFKNEVKLAAKLQHRNLIRILGFSTEGEEKVLVYEFVPNKSLDHFIFDPNERLQLSWENRYNIIEGIARGLLYLHEDSPTKIIHRDLKASNILLDEEMNPKIADFGMARFFLVNQSQTKTGRVVGTYGYMAPEYVMHGQISVKTDVFSYGVLLLEIVSGRSNKNSDQLTGSMEGGLLSYAWMKWSQEETSSLIDPNLRGNYDTSEVIRCIHIGLLCVQENVSNRPTMATVVLMLNSYSVSLPQPTSAAFLLGREFSGLPTNQSERKSINEVSLTSLSAR